MPLCLVNGAFKPLKGPFHGKRLRGESKVDRSRSEGERRQKRFDSSVTGTRGEQEFSRVGMIYGRSWSDGDPPRRILTCVSVFASSRPLCLPAPRNLPTFNHFPTIFTHTATVAQINICKKRIHTPISEAVADVKWYIYDTNSIWTEPPGTL